LIGRCSKAIVVMRTFFHDASMTYFRGCAATSMFLFFYMKKEKCFSFILCFLTRFLSKTCVLLLQLDSLHRIPNKMHTDLNLIPSRSDRRKKQSFSTLRSNQEIFPIQPKPYRTSASQALPKCPCNLTITKRMTFFQKHEKGSPQPAWGSKKSPCIIQNTHI